MERYRIELDSLLDEAWESWLGNLEISHTDTGITILIGDIADQAALHGLLSRIRNLGIPIRLIARLKQTSITTGETQ